MYNHEDYYQILSIEMNASHQEIKTAYRQLALQYHPDKNPGCKEALERFKKITEAYGVLIDPKKRREYDRYLLQCKNMERMDEGFLKYKYEEIVRDIFHNHEAQSVFEEMMKGGDIRMDEGFLKQILTSGLVFGGVFFGFWCITPFGIKGNNKELHFGHSQLRLGDMIKVLKERFKTGIQSTVRQVKGFWDSIGGHPTIEDKRSPYCHLAITQEEACKGTVKCVEFDSAEGVRRYRVKIPSGIKTGTSLRIKEQGGQTLYLRISIES